MDASFDGIIIGAGHNGLILQAYLGRLGLQLERTMRLGHMRLEQQQRYLEDIAAEEERCSTTTA